MGRKKKFDPVKILQEIAANPTSGDTARVAAAKVLLAHQKAVDPKPGEKDAPPSDAITRRALRLLSGGKS
ncbi:hypothetical protein [Hyphomicrobium sp. DY-1]|uniref:hypothetical protein n=1 Tax=Hyphomicrobium sp. DY-1 TaxID=3075650 RepID=UPI0039C47991